MLADISHWNILSHHENGPSIKILMPYFGRWPNWFWLFLETCAANPTVRWLFLTDCEVPPNPPQNIEFVPMTLDCFRQLVSEKLEMDVELPYPFKVCDFRPAFGLIFSDYLDGVDYWAWGDSDVFYGDIRRCLVSLRFEKFDIISARSEFTAGELTLLRNTKPINNLFRSSKDFEVIFKSDHCFNFVEYGFFKNRPIESFTHVARRAERLGLARLMLRDLGLNDRKFYGRPFKLYWNDGKLFDLTTGDEALLYHFLDMKKLPSFVVPEKPVDFCNGVLISPSGLEFCTRALEPEWYPIASLIERSKRAWRALRATRNHWKREGRPSRPPTG